MAAKRSTLTNKLGETYDQVIGSKRYVIKPGETITLDRYEAVEVKGHYIGAEKKCCLEIHHLPDGDDEQPKPVPKTFCAPDGKEFATKQECMEYIRKGGK